ncbi:uncharacterized protein LOC133293611 [Gastrolobium bilobum]|uniref:uncharacterized protein LOC133293611 n=1 Tax=Gastrolobium bilobum TaxID=150636 RepID=UPI002AB1FDF0|nr:uncharacterized protein LOC133293611 [Gastrolobium bilobum]
MTRRRKEGGLLVLAASENSTIAWWSVDFKTLILRASYSRGIGETLMNVYKAGIRRKSHLLACISGIDKKLHSSINAALEGLHQILWAELHKIYIQEELTWFQWSRRQWLVDEDRNMRFYHASTVIRRRHNKILMLKDERDNWVGTPEKLKSMVVKFFKNVYTNDGAILHPFPITGRFPKINSIFFIQLHRPPSREEIKDVFFNMDGLKALRPDGLHALFFQSQWPTMEVSVMRLIEDVFL